jgi:hypothetical protein
MMLRNICRFAVLLARHRWFIGLWTFIALVAAIDAYLTYRFKDLMWQLEENRVGQALIELGYGNVSIFMNVKLAGTVVALSVLVALYRYRRRWSVPVTVGIATFQFGLLGYLTLSEPAGQRLQAAEHDRPGLYPTPRTIWEDVLVMTDDFGSDAAHVSTR